MSMSLRTNKFYFKKTYGRFYIVNQEIELPMGGTYKTSGITRAYIEPLLAELNKLVSVEPHIKDSPWEFMQGVKLRLKNDEDEAYFNLIVANGFEI